MPCPSPGEIVEVRPGLLDDLSGCDLPAGMVFRMPYPGEAMPDVEPASEEPAPIVAVAEPAPAIDFAAAQAVAATDPMMGVVLAILAVAGGGAAWKHYAKISEQRHEQAMRRLEIEGAAQPPACQAAAAELGARMSAAEASIRSAAERAEVAIVLAENAEKRILRMEKAQKENAKPKPKSK